ncbi:SRPBCC domain-containing protein [Fictibacillus halophilus]|uniref:SRPBCC family protein n=1 Tax=Fictibacillus halophilus TaxID=1610490 RepID=UPI0036288586
MPTITHRTYIKADPEEIFKILTTSQGWNAWFTDDTSIKLTPEGTGEIRLRWIEFGSNKENIEDGGRILEAISNKSFIFQWTPGERKTTVSFKLEPYKEGTLIILKETGYSNSDKDLTACIGCAVGWGEAMMLLKIYIEHGIVYKQDL